MNSKNHGGCKCAAYSLGVLVGLAGCGGGSVGTATPPAQPLSMAAIAGKALFADASLSASGRQSCATCHVAARAFTSDPATDHGLPVPLGGINMDQTGFRNAPSLAYASFTPPFSRDDGPSGGFFRDGRASSLAAQARQPFLTAFEMANHDAAEVVGRLRQSADSLQKFIDAYGEAALDDPEAALTDIASAIAAFETEDESFHPFTSKFDYWQQGKVDLTAQELNGLSLFNNPGKGNCTACHPSQRQQFASHPLFTDFSYDNIGIPRNWNIPANTPGAVSPISGAPLVTIAPVNVPSDAEYAYYDMGLCGPFATSPSDDMAREDLSAHTELCGQFKVPSLRNLAITAPYFHNGMFPTIRKAIEWYVTRDINNNFGNNPFAVPAGPGGNPYQAVGTFFLAQDGTPDLYQYNDLPVVYDGNVNIGEIPYTPPSYAGGQAPTLTSAEINDVVAFLCTLTDGFDPNNPTAYNRPAQCNGDAAD